MAGFRRTNRLEVTCQRVAVHSRSWLRSFFNTVTWVLGRPWEDVQWISSLPSAHIMNTQVPWKQSARPTVVKEQNCSQMLRDWLLSSQDCEAWSPRWDLSFFYLSPQPVVPRALSGTWCISVTRGLLKKRVELNVTEPLKNVHLRNVVNIACTKTEKDLFYFIIIFYYYFLLDLDNELAWFDWLTAGTWFDFFESHQ